MSTSVQILSATVLLVYTTPTTVAETFTVAETSFITEYVTTTSTDTDGLTVTETLTFTYPVTLTQTDTELIIVPPDRAAHQTVGVADHDPKPHRNKHHVRAYDPDLDHDRDIG